MKEKRGGAREGSGRKSENKIKSIFGYKYSPEEYDLIKSILDEVKEEHKTTSKALLEIFKFYKNNKS